MHDERGQNKLLHSAFSDGESENLILDDENGDIWIHKNSHWMTLAADRLG